MNEISFYPELCEKLKGYMQSYLPKGTQIAFSFNKSLESMVIEVEELLNATSNLGNDFSPQLKLDILMGIKLPSEILVKLVLFEVKYLTQLSVAEYSQLTGYLQVSRVIPIGLLLLVVKGNSNNTLSSDFSSIISLNKLPMNWQMKVQSEEYAFRTGIIQYTPDNSILTWLPTHYSGGINSFEELTELIIH